MRAKFLNKNTTEGFNSSQLLERHLNDGNFEAATKACKTLLSEGKESSLLASSLIKSFYTRNLDKDSALSFLLELNRDINNSPELKLELADIFLKNKANYPEAIMLCSDILVNLIKQYNHAPARVTLFRLYLEENEIALAEEELAVIQESDDIPESIKEELEAAYNVKILNYGRAYEILNRLCQREEASIYAYSLLAKTVQFNQSSKLPELDELQRKLKHKKYNHEDKASAYRVLAKVHLDCQEYKEAFNYLNKSSQEYLKVFNHSTEKDFEFFDTANKFLKEFDFEVTSENQKEHLFILNFPNQVDSELSMYLSSLFNYEYLGENNFISHMLPGEKNSRTSLEQMEQIMNMVREQLDIFQEFYNENVSHKLGTNKLVLDSCAHNFLYAAIIKKIFPNAKFLSIKANKLNALSQSFLNNIETANFFANYNLKISSEFYNKYESYVSEIQNKFPDSFLEINLEKDLDENGLIKESKLEEISTQLMTDLNLELHQEYKYQNPPKEISDLVKKYI